MATKQMKLHEIQDVTQQDHTFKRIPELPPKLEQLSERECIKIIREHGTEDMKTVLERILEGNKWKVKKTDMWKRFWKGKKLVRRLYRDKGRDILDN